MITHPLDIAEAEYFAKRDTELLDHLQATTTGYGNGWVLRNSASNRGMRLHETSGEGTSKTVREAIAKHMEGK